MADNYTQFSFTLEHLTRAEIKWIKKILYSNATDDAEELKKLLSTKVNKPAGELEYWPEFEWVLEKNTLHIYSEECGNELNAAAFVHAFLATFRPKEVVIFSVCYSCSKMRVGEFGGQDWIITAHDIINTGDIAQYIYRALMTRKDQKVRFSSIELTVHKFKRGEHK